MKKILVTATNYSKYCQEGKKILEDYGCEIVENPHDRPYTPEELKKIVADIDADRHRLYDGLWHFIDDKLCTRRYRYDGMLFCLFRYLISHN